MILTKPTGKKRGAPVLVWIYGGGYVGGYKTSSGSPASLIARSQENGKEGVVYVALNYRLGLFVSFIPHSSVTPIMC
jgi:carboxylesterase type B